MKNSIIILLLLFCISFSAAAEFKPNIDGYKEWYDIGAKHESYGSDDARKYVRGHPYYQKIPSDIYNTFSWKERLKLKLEGRLDKDIYASYDVEQEHDMPERINIYLKVFQHEFTFGDFESAINGGPFATVTKKLNGFMYFTNQEKFNVRFIQGEERSNTDIYILNGDGVKKIFIMRYNPIVEGSMKIYVNNARQAENTDYQVNYTAYTVTLETTYGPEDVIKFVYDYSNPLEDFIRLDRQKFMGLRAEFMVEAETTKVRIKEQTKENLDVASKANNPDSNNAETLENGVFKLLHSNVVQGSETIIYQGEKLKLNQAYTMDYTRGIVTLPPREWSLLDRIEVEYSFYKAITANETLFGAGTIGPYILTQKDIVENSEAITVEGTLLRSDEDYIIDHRKGEIIFKRPINLKAQIQINYQYYLNTVPADKKPKYNWFYGGATYLQKKAAGKEGVVVHTIENQIEQKIATVSNSVVFRTRYWPIKQGSIGILANGHLLEPNYGITTNYDWGIVTINFNSATYNEVGVTTSLTATSDIKFNYQYYIEKGPLSYQFTGASDRTNPDSPLVSSYNITAYKYLVDVPYSLKIDRDTTMIKLLAKRGEQPFELKDYGIDYEICYEKDSLGRYSGQISIVLYQAYADQYGQPIGGFALDGEDVFEVKYYYVLKNASDTGDFQHDLYATDLHFNLPENIKINVDAAYSQREFNRNVLSAYKELAETGRYDTIYNLGHTNIVEGSESIEKNGNVLQLEPGRDYILSYAQGEIKFIGFAPNSEDAIVVYFDYYSDEASATMNRIRETGYATRADTSYTNDKLEVAADYSHIDDTFQPFSGIKGLSLPVGSTQWGTKTKYKIADNASVYYEKIDLENKTQEKQGDEYIYKKTVDDKYGATYQPYPWLGTDVYQLRETEVSDHLAAPVITQNTHTIDTRKTETGININTGPETFSTKLNYKQINKESGFLDKYQQETNDTNMLGLTNIWMPLQNMRLDTQYSQSNQDVRDLSADNRRKASDDRKHYGTALKSKWFNCVALDAGIEFTSVDYITSYNANEKPITGNREKYELRDYDYLVNYTPDFGIPALNQFQAQLKEDHSEKAGFVFGQKSSISNEQAYLLKANPYNKALLSYNGSNLNKKENDGTLINRNHRDRYDIMSYTPVEWLVLDRIAWAKDNSYYKNTVLTGISQNVMTRESDLVDLQYSLMPVDNLKYTNNFIKDRSKDINTTYKYSTSNIQVTSRPKDTVQHRVYYKITESPQLLGDSSVEVITKFDDQRTNINNNYYSSQNFNSLSYSESSYISKKFTDDNLIFKANPLRIIKSTYTYYKQMNYTAYKQINDTGQAEKNLENKNTIQMEYPIMKNISLKTDWAGLLRHEWLSTQNVDEETVEDVYRTRLTRNKNDYGLGLFINTIPNITFETTGVMTNFSEKNSFIGVTSNQLIYKQYSLVPGATVQVNKFWLQYFKFDPGKLVMTYRHYFDFFQIKNAAAAAGFRSRCTIEYTPFQVKNVTGLLTYSRQAVWGTNTNEAQQQKDANLGINTSQTTIKKQNYLEEELKADLIIKVPINESVLNTLEINLSAILLNAKDYTGYNDTKDYYLFTWLGGVKLAF